MNRRWAVGAAAAVILGAGCGGGTGASTTSGATTTTTTAATTTTAGEATTSVPTTTLAADAHPTFGLSWDAVWPGPDETATYRATTGDQVLELTARVEYGVEFRGMTVDRFVVGTPEGGNDGMAVYLDRSEPWVLRVMAVESFDAEVSGGPALSEVFEEPLVLDGTIAVGEEYEVASIITIDFPGGGAPDSLGVSYRVLPAEVEAGFDSPLGPLDDVLRVEASVGGEFMGGGLFDVVLWLHADHFLVRFEGAPAWDLLEIIAPWG